MTNDDRDAIMDALREAACELGVRHHRTPEWELASLGLDADQIRMVMDR